MSLKEYDWTTASDLQQHFGRITCFISNKSTYCLGIPQTAGHKQLTVLFLKILKDNQNITILVVRNILVIGSMQRRK